RISLGGVMLRTSRSPRGGSILIRKSTWLRRRVVAFCLAASCVSCVHTVKDNAVFPGFPESPKLYTLTNLHPEENDKRLYAATFQQAGLIPVCPEVRFLRSRESPRPFATFEVVSTGKVYEYDYHDAGGEPLPENLKLYFGSECPQAQLDQLTDA